jgi:hypothetical protein
MAESSATYEVPIVARPTETAVNPAPIAEDRPADTPMRCILLHVSPSSSSAYGLRGEVVQLVVRGQNGCSTHFRGASFRVTAIGSGGQPVGSASGSFSSGFPPGGSAETLVAIPTKPSLAFGGHGVLISGSRGIRDRSTFPPEMSAATFFPAGTRTFPARSAAVAAAPAPST